jgi:hypothetical protein
MTSTSHSQGQSLAHSRPAADEYPAPSRIFDLLVMLGALVPLRPVPGRLGA